MPEAWLVRALEQETKAQEVEEIVHPCFSVIVMTVAIALGLARRVAVFTLTDSYLDQVLR